MKLIPTLLCAALLGSASLAASPAAHAQINVNVSSPNWGPTVPQGSQYYYIPETSGFYDVPARQYIIRRDGRWIRTSTLSGYNTANFHPVIVDYVGAEPWSRYDEYRARYPRGGNPSNGAMPPGQAKKQGYRANPSNGGLPPGQAKKQGYRYDNDRDDDRRYDGDDYGKDKGKYKNKGKGKKDKD